MESNDKYLPIGTIFLTKNDIVMKIIIGYLQLDKTNEEVKDYVTIPFPFGMMSMEMLNYYNHEDIEKIIYTGYKNDDFNKFNEALK